MPFFIIIWEEVHLHLPHIRKIFGTLTTFLEIVIGNLLFNQLRCH